MPDTDCPLCGAIVRGDRSIPEGAVLVTEETLAAALLNVGISELDWWTSELVKGEDEAATPFAAALLARIREAQ